MKTKDYKDYQDFIDFAKILKIYYGRENNKRLSQGKFIRKLFENICNADIDFSISQDDGNLSRYLRDRPIYANASKVILASLNRGKFERWIRNKDITDDALKRLLRDCRVFINNHPTRFDVNSKEEIFKFDKLETAGRFVAEIFINILSSPDACQSGQNKKPQRSSSKINDIPEAFEIEEAPLLLKEHRGSDNLYNENAGWQQSTALPVAIDDFAKLNETAHTEQLDVIKGVLNRQADQITNELKEARDEARENIQGLAERVKDTPNIAVGVNEANTKLDTIIKSSSSRNKYRRITFISIASFVAVAVVALIVFTPWRLQQGTSLDDDKATTETHQTLRRTISVGGQHAVGIKPDGTVVTAGSKYGYHEYGLGRNEHYIDLEFDKIADWNGIVSVAASPYHTVGLKSDGTVVAAGLNLYGQCDVSDWKNIIAVAVGEFHTVGLRSNYTVITTPVTWAVSLNDAKDWDDIIAIQAGDNFTIGLKKDGSLVSTLENHVVTRWKGVTAISAGYGHIVGLLEDKTIISDGDFTLDDQYVVEKSIYTWKNIVAIANTDSCVIGLKSNGSVVGVGVYREIVDENYYENGQQKYFNDAVSTWVDIVDIAVGPSFVIGLKSDGTVVSEGHYNWGEGQLDLSAWGEIMVPYEMKR